MKVLLWSTVLAIIIVIRSDQSVEQSSIS